MNWDLLLFIPLAGAAVLLAIDLVGRPSWWMIWLGYSACMLIAVGIVGRSQITTMGPLELAASVVLCFLITLICMFRRWNWARK